MVLQASSQGLRAADAARRLQQDGPNSLPGDQRRSLGSIARETLGDPMFMLLLVLVTSVLLVLAYGVLRGDWLVALGGH